MGNLQSNASSSAQTTQKNYEVFLNFRGIDTRDDFINYLYEALRAKSIETFRDEEKIPKGNELGPTLLKAIRESKIAVVIFSKEYASSKWCLRELVEIMECKKKNDQIVIPVFYKIAVHDVRHQEGSFKDGFDQLEKEFQEKLKKEHVDSAYVEKIENGFYEEMQNWREALKAACDLKGHLYEKGPKAEIIDKIVKDIWEKLMRTYKLSPYNFEELFGIEDRLKQVMTLLCLGETDIRIIGIWGMGGLGKTTIAEVIYELIPKDEYGMCFVRNVRGKLKQRGGLVDELQQEVLSKVLEDENIKLDGVTLPQHIKQRLYQKKVFIVLDDVDDNFKLTMLARGLDRLSPGSRIIMTTRDREILRKCQVNKDYIYEVKGLSDEEAQKLFCKHALIQSPLTKDLMALLHETLKAINGNPLGLIVVSSSLPRWGKQKWQSALNKLKRASDIFDVLQISYDGLKEEDRRAFLDIACFLVGEYKGYVEEILDNSCSLEVLFDRSLITISDVKTIEMHYLLQELGKEIVSREHCRPRERSRLWIQEDVLNTLKKGDGTDLIRGIALDMSKMNEEHLDSKAFEKMTNLRFLKFYDPTFDDYVICRYNPYYSNVHFPNGMGYLTSNLRSLDWLGCPLKALPSNFNPQELVALDLRHSNIENLWEDYKVAPKLKWIILRFCPFLVKVIDGLHAPLLKTIDIEDCDSFHGFTSHNRFPSLTYLHLSMCNELTGISDRLDAPSLETIVIQSCENLLAFPPPVEHFNNLRMLKIKNCKKLQSFPNNISFPSLTCLDLCNCFNLVRIAVIIDAPLLKYIGLYSCKLSLPSIIQFPLLIGLTLWGIDSFQISDLLLDVPLLEKIDLSCCISLLEFSSPVYHVFNNLRELKVTDCENLQSFGKNIHFPSLVSVDLSGCHSLTELSDLSDAPLLEMIILVGCRSLLHFPTPCHHFNNLRRLILDRCKNLQSFPSDIHFPSLTYLSFTRCISLTMFPNISGNIKELWMSNTAIHEVPSTIENLPELGTLVLSECTRLKVISTSICKLKALSYLDLSCCSALECFPEILDAMESLKFLSFAGCINLTMFPNISGNINSLYMRNTAIHEVPSTIENLPELLVLDLAECTRLKVISTSICKLKALKHLDLSNCSALKCFPEILDTRRILKDLESNGTAVKGLHHSIENDGGLENPSIAAETSGAADQDFGKTSVEEQGKIRKFLDEAETSGRSNEDVIEPHSERTWTTKGYTLLHILTSIVCSCSWSCSE